MVSEILTNPVEEYLYSLLPESPPVLKEMEAAAAKRNIPIIGPLVGRYFYQLATIHKAKRIFELGSAIGYSTLWWAMAAGDDAQIFYTDSSKENSCEAAGYFIKMKLEKRIQILTGDALEMLDKTPGEFDIIFCDIDKDGYPDAFRKALPRLRKGGLFVCDNVLWSGRVAQKNPDNWTKAIQEFNRLCYNTPGLWTTIIPLRDGVSVSLKY